LDGEEPQTLLLLLLPLLSHEGLSHDGFDALREELFHVITTVSGDFHTMSGVCHESPDDDEPLDDEEPLLDLLPLLPDLPDEDDPLLLPLLGQEGLPQALYAEEVTVVFSND